MEEEPQSQRPALPAITWEQHLATYRSYYNPVASSLPQQQQSFENGEAFQQSLPASEVAAPEEVVVTAAQIEEAAKVTTNDEEGM